MKFNLTTTLWIDEFSDNYSEIIREFNVEHKDNCWYVSINTLEELLKLLAVASKRTCVRGIVMSYDMDGRPEIEIYDDYRE